MTEQVASGPEVRTGTVDEGASGEDLPPTDQPDAEPGEAQEDDDE